MKTLQKNSKPNPVKNRAHFVLFAQGTPFKPKKVERKDLYNRKDKSYKSIIDE